MPLVRIEIIAGKQSDYKKMLLQTVHDALVISLGIEEDDRYARLYELSPDCFERRSAKTDQFTLIELTIFPGRSKELKRAVIKQITQMLQDRLGIAPTDVMIVMHEPPLDNWGCYGEQASELGMRYLK